MIEGRALRADRGCRHLCDAMSDFGSIFMLSVLKQGRRAKDIPLQPVELAGLCSNAFLGMS